MVMAVSETELGNEAQHTLEALDETQSHKGHRR